MTPLFAHLDETLRPTRPRNLVHRETFGRAVLFRVQKGAMGLFRQSTTETVLIEIVKSDEYGGSALYGQGLLGVALEPCEVMEWPAADDNGLMYAFCRDRLVLAADRLVISLAHQTYRRTAAAYLWLAERVGEAGAQGWVTLPRYATHEFVGHIVGTSREIVNGHTVKMQKLGAVGRARVAVGNRLIGVISVNPSMLRALATDRHEGRLR